MNHMHQAASSDLVLSVVICTYNNSALLAEALTHLQGQRARGTSFEVLVIDNNCTDDTATVVTTFQPRFAHLRRIVESRQGQMFARVRGVRESRAPWIAFVDDDNFLSPDWIASALAFIAEHPHCVAFGGKVVIDWEALPPPEVASRAYAFASTDLGPEARMLEGDDRWRLRGAGLVCRKESLERCGWLDWQVCAGRAGRGTMSGDDTEIVMRVAREGGQLWYQPGCHLRHRIAARRLTWTYLRSLHYSFAAADPLLLGLRTRGSMLSWTGRLGMLFLRRIYWLARHGVRGLRDRRARETAVLTYDTLCGAARGAGAVTQMRRSQRLAWLGRSAAGAASASRRILHLADGRKYGGIQRMLVCLAAERAHSPAMEPDFVLGSHGRLAEELKGTGVRVNVVGPVRTSRPWKWVRAVWRVNRLLARENIAAMVCHGSWSLALFGFCARWRRLPLVLWMHNDTKIRNKNFVERLAGRCRPDLVIANSNFTATSLSLLFPQPPPHVVLPCPVSRPAPSPGRRAELRAEFNTPSDALVIVLAGRPEPWKGHALLLAALARLGDCPGWICWIVGGAFDAEQERFLSTLWEAAERGGFSDRVRWIGQRQDVAQILAAADIFCQPNLTPEPFGIVFVEALYAGLPVVTGDHGGGREIVDDSCGRLITPGDESALTDALRELLVDHDLRRRLGSQAPVRGARISDPAIILPALESTLTRLASPDVSSRPVAPSCRPAIST